MKRYGISIVIVLLSALLCAQALGASGEDPISKLKLQQSALPQDMQITKEVQASKQQLQKIRMRAGFPVVALLNQAVSFKDAQAQVNYLLPPGDSWLSAGYSNLIQADGKKSFIFAKNSIIVQIAATSYDLEQRISHLLGAEPVYYLRPRRQRLPSTWDLHKEKVFTSNDLAQLESEMGVPVKAALSQNFLAGHSYLELQYFQCDAPSSNTQLIREIAKTKKPLEKVLIGISGSLVAVCKSQSEELNRQAVLLLQWPNEEDVQYLPLR